MRMNERDHSPDGFRHQKRTLEAGESIPRAPSLFEQLAALGGATCTPDESTEELIGAAVDEPDDLDLE